MRVATENEHKAFVAEYKQMHKVLNLQIKQQNLTEIMNGTKKQEFREIRPTTESKYILRDEEKFALEDPDRFITVTENIEVETKKNEDGSVSIVYNNEEENTVELLLIFMTKNEDGVEYEAVDFMGQTYEVVRAHDEEGNEVTDEDGNPTMAIVNVEELHCCIPIKYDAINFYIGNTPDTDHALVEVKDAHTEFMVDEDENPIWYDNDGERYYVEQVVFDLGVIICEYKK